MSFADVALGLILGAALGAALAAYRCRCREMKEVAERLKADIYRAARGSETRLEIKMDEVAQALKRVETLTVEIAGRLARINVEDCAKWREVIGLYEEHQKLQLKCNELRRRIADLQQRLEKCEAEKEELRAQKLEDCL